MTSADTTFTVLSGTGYPSPATGQYFVVCIDAGATSEEKVLCSARSGTTFTVASGGRGYDGTTAASHSAGTTNVTHVLSAAEVDDTSDHIYTTTRDDHTQYAKTDGTRAFTGGISVTGNSTITGNLTVTGTLTGPDSVAASMYLSSNQTITNATTATLSPMTSSFTEGSATVASNTITVPTTGYYLVTANALLTATSGNSGQWENNVQVNGTTKLQGVWAGTANSSAFGLPVSGILSLTANDALTLQVSNFGGASVVVGGYAQNTYLSVVKVG